LRNNAQNYHAEVINTNFANCTVSKFSALVTDSETVLSVLQVTWLNFNQWRHSLSTDDL